MHAKRPNPASLIASFTILVITGVPAHASSSQAWAEFDARVTKSCVRASGIGKGRPSRIVGFDDRVGLVALLVTDPSHATPAKLCLYNKKTRQVFVDEAAGWIAPPQAR
jgi:hypothetical protein